MGSQRLTLVDTPLGNGRKRNASEPCHIESTIETLMVTAMAKRVLSSNQPTPAPRNIVVSEAGVHRDDNPSVEQLVVKLSTAMHIMLLSLRTHVSTGIRVRTTHFHQSCTVIKQFKLSLIIVY